MQRFELFAPIYKYIDDICEMCIKEKKRIVIYGAAMGGRFLRHLIEDISGYALIDMYIDDKKDLYFTNGIYRSSILDYIDCTKYVVLNSAVDRGDIYTKCQEYHFVMGKTFFDVRKDIGRSYLEYLEKKYANVDFSQVRIDDRPDLYKKQINMESTPFEDASIVRVFEAVDILRTEKTFWDYGCGKGQILLMACLHSYKKIGGIDLNQDCCETATRNLRQFGYSARIIYGDAAKYQDIDDYSIFFMFNPFGAEVLTPVLHNIENSYCRRKRNIFLIYGNPFWHRTVIKESRFQLIKQIRIDNFDPLLNIYALRKE